MLSTAAQSSYLHHTRSFSLKNKIVLIKHRKSRCYIAMTQIRSLISAHSFNQKKKIRVGVGYALHMFVVSHNLF